jgi:hypothetical protein
MQHTIESLHSLGFDNTSLVFGRPKMFAVSCSQCESLVINGTPTHERGCPNTMHECNGCNEMIPYSHKYCADCA